MAQSILASIKKLIGYSETDESFDLDIMIHINAALAILTQLGIGPREGFMIEDSTATWDDFAGPDPRLKNMAKSYVYIKVRLIFDPPGTSFVIESMNKQIAEFEWRLNVQREEESWTDPALPAA